MFDKWFKAPVHDALHYLGALILIVGLPMNKVLMSIGTIWLAANLLLKADFKSCFERLKKSRVAILVVLILFLHFFGLIYTSDFAYAMHDLNSKLPFFTLPIVLIAYPIKKLFFKDLIYAFLMVVFLTSITNMIYFHLDGRNKIEDVRYMSLFGSHIRYGVLVVFAAFLSIYFLFKEEKRHSKYLLALLFIWLVFYTVYSQVMTAYLNLIIISLVAVFYQLSRMKNVVFRYSLILLLVFFCGYISYKLVDYLRPDFVSISLNELDTHTVLGNKYHHQLEHGVTENGSPIMIYISEVELKEKWNASSSIDYNGFDHKGQVLKGTLFRYMSSLGLRKDAEGFAQLTAEDIKNIEKGTPSRSIADSFIMERMEGLRLQFQNYYLGQDPSGHSLLQRFEHWRASLYIINENPIFGVGTGDIPEAFKNAYIAINSPLHPDYHNRSHNQFLAFWAAFGIAGLVTLVLLNISVLQKAIQQKNWIYFVFGLLCFLSFIPEDTLETQQGATFIGFFLGFLYQKQDYLKF